MVKKWEQIGQDIDGEAAGDQSGYSISLSSDGNIVAIGAPYNDGNGDRSGHVRVYQYNIDKWEQIGNDIDGEAEYDGSGYSVSLSSDGKTVAIGAPDNLISGHVRVYQYNIDKWDQIGQDIDGEAKLDSSGYSVSLSSDGKTVAIGAYLNDGNGENSGHVRVYEYKSNEWEQIGNDIDGEAEYDGSGYSLSLSSDGKTVAIGAPWNDNGEYSGHVRVYQYNGNKWEQIGNDIDGEAKLDSSGSSVSLSSDGKTVAIGAIWNDDNGKDSGHVKIYQYNGNKWEQIGQDIDGESAGNQSGWSVSLSSDGNTVAIGAPYNNDNGDRSGHVRVYQYNIDKWEQIGQDIDGEAKGDFCGFSVSLSSDGKTVAISTPIYIISGIKKSGHVRVYQLTESEPIPEPETKCKINKRKLKKLNKQKEKIKKKLKKKN